MGFQDWQNFNLGSNVVFYCDNEKKRTLIFGIMDALKNLCITGNNRNEEFLGKELKLELDTNKILPKNDGLFYEVKLGLTKQKIEKIIKRDCEEQVKSIAEYGHYALKDTTNDLDIRVRTKLPQKFIIMYRFYWDEGKIMTKMVVTGVRGEGIIFTTNTKKTDYVSYESMTECLDKFYSWILWGVSNTGISKYGPDSDFEVNDVVYDCVVSEMKIMDEVKYTEECDKFLVKDFFLRDKDEWVNRGNFSIIMTRSMEYVMAEMEVGGNKGIYFVFENSIKELK